MSFADGFSSLFPFINALFCGVLVGALLSWVELFLLAGDNRFMRFYKILALRTLIYSFGIPTILFSVFITSRAVDQQKSVIAIFYSEEFQKFLSSDDFLNAIVYVFVAAFIVSFTLQIARKMGQRVFTSFVLGKYYHPKKVDRLFLFVRLSNSEEIIDKNGRLKFHQLIKELTYLLADPVLLYQGVIHHYVDDDVVIYWNLKAGLKNANVIRFFKEFKSLIRERRDDLYEHYGVLPKFHAAAHLGEVVQGEIGELKSEIAFYGDVMNTTSRILSECVKSDQEILVSEEVQSKIELPQIWKWISHGTVHLEGKLKATEIYTVKAGNLPQGIPV